MIIVRIEVSGPGGFPEATTLVAITNQGPVCPDEAWDSGGERRYLVESGERQAVVRHFRRDGLLPLVQKAIGALT